jgi:metal-sulfur cluster biosynthetic enzyme
MTMMLLGVLAVEEKQLRLVAADGRRALDVVRGMPAAEAVVRLRFGRPSCEPLARLIETALARAERAGELIVTGGAIDAAEDIVRVRRKAHGKADWIASPSSRVRIELRPAGLAASSPDVVLEALKEPEPRDVTVEDENVRRALFDVIDPDLGVNVVDLGFVRGIKREGEATVIRMTLTSPACPLATQMEEQIRRRLGGDVRVEWVWSPAWHPSDISEGGRWELSAIGFSFPS